jgi:hypothetical protein
MLISGHRSVPSCVGLQSDEPWACALRVQRVLIEATDAGADRFHPAFQKSL